MIAWVALGIGTLLAFAHVGLRAAYKHGLPPAEPVVVAPRRRPAIPWRFITAETLLLGVSAGFFYVACPPPDLHALLYYPAMVVLLLAGWLALERYAARWCRDYDLNGNPPIGASIIFWPITLPIWVVILIGYYPVKGAAWLVKGALDRAS